MSELAIRRPLSHQSWPMTGEAWLTLVDELGRLRADAFSLAGELADGVIDLAVVKAARRLDVLSAVLDAAERIHEPGLAVIGRRVTIREADGESVNYSWRSRAMATRPRAGSPPTRRLGRLSSVASPATGSRSERRLDSESSPCCRSSSRSYAQLHDIDRRRQFAAGRRGARTRPTRRDRSGSRAPVLRERRRATPRRRGGSSDGARSPRSRPRRQGLPGATVRPLEPRTAAGRSRNLD